MFVTNGQNRSYQLIERADAIAISLDENGATGAAAQATYRLDIYVLADEGKNYLGTLNTVAAVNTPLGPSRIVGYAVCPGARGWMIETFGTCQIAEGPNLIDIKVTAELRAQQVNPSAWGEGIGVFGVQGRTILNGVVNTAIGADSTAPLASSRTDFTSPILFTGAFGSNESASTIWIMFFDSAVIPPNGTQPTDGLSFNVPPGGSFSFVADPPGLFFLHGLTWVASSTPNTLTAIAPGATARVVTKATF